MKQTRVFVVVEKYNHTPVHQITYFPYLHNHLIIFTLQMALRISYVYNCLMNI